MAFKKLWLSPSKVLRGKFLVTGNSKRREMNVRESTEQSSHSSFSFPSHTGEEILQITLHQPNLSSRPHPECWNSLAKLSNICKYLGGYYVWMATIHSTHIVNCVQNYNFVNISCGHSASVMKKYVIIVNICWVIYLHIYIYTPITCMCLCLCVCV